MPRSIFMKQVRLLLHGVAKRLTGTEMRNLRGRDIDLVAGLRITTHAGFSLGNGKSPESDEADLLALFQIICDISEKAVQGIIGLTFADPGIRRDFVYHFFLGHGTHPLHRGFKVTDLMPEKTPFLESKSTKKM